jgi:hypothetical protein
LKTAKIQQHERTYTKSGQCNQKKRNKKQCNQKKEEKDEKKEKGGEQ